MKESAKPLSSLTIAGIASPNSSSVGSPPPIGTEKPAQSFLERVFDSPNPPARKITSYLDIEDIVNLRKVCVITRDEIQRNGKWSWMLHRLSSCKTYYPSPDPRIRRLNLGVPPSQRDGFRNGREFVLVDVSIGDRDILNINSTLQQIQASECLVSLILDGTRIDAGDVGHLLKNFQNVTTLSLQHCWNVDLQLLYKLFKKTTREHNDEVNYYKHPQDPIIKSKRPAEQITRLRIWDIDGLQILLDESPENGHRMISQIGAQFFMRNFDLDVKRCTSTHHTVFMACVGEKVGCSLCGQLLEIEICPKCRLESSCEICGDYICLDCSRNKSAKAGSQSSSRIHTTLNVTVCRSALCKWHDNRHYNHLECTKRASEKCVQCSRHVCLLQRASMGKSFNCEVCRRFSCGCRQLKYCSRCHGYMCDECFSSHGDGCQWRKG
ncbi:hypothetical protein TWF694_011455 [Orbilia ellipsospora]|uniref:F-box domain-containing protein n=1 Tax=Orbilia ellipsospora TaxID=2528407 RepID=A0AAV9X5A4_9PEZI